MLSSEDGTPWALYAMAEDGQKIPQEGQCQDCYELWTKGFSYLTWACLCKTHDDSLEFATVVAKARAVKHGQAKLECRPQEVVSSQRVILQVERSLQVVSEKELRKLTKLPRIGKTVLKGVPVLEIPEKDGGEAEKVYAFLDEDCPLRKAKIIVQSSSALDSFIMPKSTMMYENQGPPIFKNLSQDLGQQQWCQQPP